MPITPELKALMAEKTEMDWREALALRLAEKEAARVERIMRDIDEAAPLLDAEPVPGTKWRRSSLVRLGYCVIATGTTPGCEMRGIDFVRNSIASVSGGSEG